MFFFSFIFLFFSDQQNRPFLLRYVSVHSHWHWGYHKIVIIIKRVKNEIKWHFFHNSKLIYVRSNSWNWCHAVKRIDHWFDAMTYFYIATACFKLDSSYMYLNVKCFSSFSGMPISVFGIILWLQWCSQGLPRWATRPPEGPKWGRKWANFEEK